MARGTSSLEQRGDASSSASRDLALRLIASLLPIKSVLGGRAALGDCGEQAAGLTPRHVHLLVEVLVRGPLSVSSLAEIAGANLASASVAASQLEAAGLVVRTEDPVDHRRTLVRALPGAEAFVAAFLATRAAALEHALAQLEPGHAEQLVELLDELAKALRVSIREARTPLSARSPQVDE
ncbi:transcriptional regulator, MarR family [Acidimicrobium ferrooxidans DSM 10331]|uniref:Transcriptional regulator, MarR family n=1 Tax=Acidimicrobium ferrooxidans (strain DSM 10331 / JCM 15462 / NBRC 103882 / ICP) TaxID=525909 RepID=C7M3E5_ACIFD|nr:MarR family winged helix-turn-helix transcriptional regulator [Acidimicrobium ferrooxidans]ACU53539.1 transcriptional regulator, MarR family [Acidimicrobium ferrooxidans DSM 10331]